MLKATRSCLLCAAAACLLVAGCGSEPAVQPNVMSGSNTGASTSSRDDELRAAIRYARLVNEYDYDTASEKTLDSLNTWLASIKEEADYKVDPLRDRLPKEIQPFFPPNDLEAGKFRRDDFVNLRQYLATSRVQTPIAMGVRSSDFRYLHETHLFRRIVDWAAKQPIDPQTEAWLEEHGKTLDDRSARKLREVTRLFDWTIRHLQLEEALPEPDRNASGPTAAGSSQQTLPPALQGQPGPGYTLFPGHAVLTGRGDFVQRAWVFCLLARQAECDVVMLAFENSATNRPEPWACGALIGGEIYLFDTRLGLPVPLENDVGVATLKQVRENDALLRRLDLSAELVYPANPDSLKRLIALVEFCDASISKRMRLLESRLTGDEQMVLFVRPSEIAEAVRKAGVSQVYPWRIAYDTILYRAAIEANLRSNFAFYTQYYTYETPFLRPSTLSKARFKHFNAEFTTDGEEIGALDEYMNSRVADVDIARFEQSDEARRVLSTRVVGERELTDQDKAQYIAAQKQAMLIAKTHASYFMGLAQYDLGAYDIAVEWFQRRTLDVQPPSPWTNSARYNLARALEMLKKYREARAIYLGDASPQKHGNLIRARRLRPLADAQPVEKTEETSAANGG